MKSIKEKAIETYPALEGDVSGTSENLVRRDGFQAGANYVLDEIEKLVKFNRWSAQDLYELIEQLKSNHK